MKPVLVTGTTRGLGLAIATRLLSWDYKIIGTGRNQSEASSSLAKSNPNYIFQALDFSVNDGIAGFVKQITEEHGQLYGLVNNAALGYDGILPTIHEKQIYELLDVNLLAPILLAKYASRSMLVSPHRGGRIINISSIVASTGYKGLSVYAATKAGLIGFTRSLARELGSANITVNAVAPGFMQTDMTSGLQENKMASIKRRCALPELARPEDVADAVEYLLSNEAKNITGTTLTVDAGSSA